jgi:hypothetical protein
MERSFPCREMWEIDGILARREHLPLGWGGRFSKLWTTLHSDLPLAFSTEIRIASVVTSSRSLARSVMSWQR